jgi:hypothetical protein
MPTSRHHTLRKRGETHIATGTSLRTMLVTTTAGFWGVHLCHYNAAHEPPPAATTPSTSHQTTTSSTSHYNAVHKPLRRRPPATTMPSTSHYNAVPKPLQRRSPPWEGVEGRASNDAAQTPGAKPKRQRRSPEGIVDLTEALRDLVSNSAAQSAKAAADAHAANAQEVSYMVCALEKMNEPVPLGVRQDVLDRLH